MHVNVPDGYWNIFLLLHIEQYLGMHAQFHYRTEFFMIGYRAHLNDK